MSNGFLTLGAPLDTLEAARALPRIGVEADAAMDVLLTREGFTKLERVDRPEVTAQKLRAGRIDAWALTDELALWTWRRLGYREPLTVGAPIEVAQVYLVGHPDCPEPLTSAYAAAVESMRADGTLAAIVARYR